MPLLAQLKKRIAGVGTTVALVAASGALMVATAPVASANPGPIAGRTSSIVSADALPTVQVDGVVWSQAIVGNTVYAGGEFANARPAGAAAGSNLSVRNNLLSYNLTTGALNTGFVPDLNGAVETVAGSPDGTRIYVGGNFQAANGSARYRIAAYDTATGLLVKTFAPKVDYTVNAIIATNSTVYVGGAFSTSAGVTRSRLAAYNASNGGLLNWAPAANGAVHALTFTPDGTKVVIGGSFTTLSSVSAIGIGAVDATTGAVLPWNTNAVIKNGGTNSAILTLSTDGSNVYGGGYKFGAGGNLEGTFKLDPNNGTVLWMEDCHGDTYGVYASASAMYQVGHAHYCGNNGGWPQPATWNFNRAVAFTKDATGTLIHDPMGGGYSSFAGAAAPSMYQWFPELAVGTVTGKSQAAWTVTGNADYVVLGGEFPSVNGVGQQGLVRFAVSALAPDAQGPRLSGSQYKPTVSITGTGAVRIAFTADWDRDDKTLTYNIIRNGNTAAPIKTFTADSTEWNRPSLGFVDANVVAGTSYAYRLQVVDGSGNTVLGDAVTIVAASAGAAPLTGYGQTVLNQGASLYWPMNDTTGTLVRDRAGFNDATKTSGATFGAAGIPAADTAMQFDGTAGSLASSGALVAPATFTVEAWFKTTSTKGGRIVGFSDLQTGVSGHRDRQIYMNNTGKLTFGVWGTTTNTVTGAASYNDGQWHQAVASLDSTGMSLYVDGVRVANRVTPTSVNAESYIGYWRVGGDSLGSWSNVGSSAYLAGTIDEVSVYPTALSAAQIAAQNTAGRNQTPVNALPSAAFTSSVNQLAATFNGATSTDSDGTISSYAWNFGDNTSGTGATASHTYSAAGTYQVSLTVTDNSGGVSVTTKSITVAAAPPANTSPTAAFTSSVNQLAATFNGATSTDSDGTISSYVWNFGDNTSAAGVTASHTYSAAGTYQVTLTVTDNGGATNTKTASVTVTAPATPAALASDAFARTVTSAWGSADAGGTWTVAGGSAGFSVSSGAGRISLASAASQRTATLAGVSAANVDLSVSVAVDKIPVGGNTQVSASVRKVGNSEYRTMVAFKPTGEVQLVVLRIAAGVQTTLKSYVLPGVTYAIGDTINIRFQVAATSTAGTSSLQAKAWRSTDTQPAGWQVVTTDSTAALQGAGAVSLFGYLASSATGFPVQLSFKNFTVTAPVA